MGIETVSALSAAIADEGLLQKHSLEKIGVFGSFARGEASRDIDFYIDSDGYKIEDLSGLKEDLERVTGRDVDIMLKKYANPIILYRAGKDMIYVTKPLPPKRRGCSKCQKR